MSRRTTRLLDLLCEARNKHRHVKTVQKQLLDYDDDPARFTTFWPDFKARAEDEVRRWSQKRDKAIAKLRR
jgi:hypothetical protein